METNEDSPGGESDILEIVLTGNGEETENGEPVTASGNGDVQQTTDGVTYVQAIDTSGSHETSHISLHDYCSSIADGDQLIVLVDESNLESLKNSGTFAQFPEGTEICFKENEVTNPSKTDNECSKQDAQPAEETSKNTSTSDGSKPKIPSKSSPSPAKKTNQDSSKIEIKRKESPAKSSSSPDKEKDTSSKETSNHEEKEAGKQATPTQSTSNAEEEENDLLSEEEAQKILMTALKKISPKIGKDFVLMFKDPSTSEVKEIASDKGKQFLEHNTDVVEKFSILCDDKDSEENVEKEKDDESLMETESDICHDDTSEKEETTSKKSSVSNNREQLQPVKRAPRTSVMLKTIAKLEEKEKARERLQNTQMHACELCPSKFGIVGNLNKHMKNKHNIDIAGKKDVKAKEAGDKTEQTVTVKVEPTDDEMTMQNCGDFETIVSVSISTPCGIDSSNAEKKRGRGRPRKSLSTSETNTENDGGQSIQRPVSKPKKSTVDVSDGKESSVKKSTKNDGKTAQTPKANYTDEDLECFIKTLDLNDSKMNLECKLCLLRFVSHRRAWDHVLQEHRENVMQCTRTLDLYPDTTKSCRFDSYIYIIEEDSKEGIIPTDLFSTLGRGGRKRTPSKKLLESQEAGMKKTYVCKICHRKGANKTSILQHMKKFHFDVLPPTKEDSGQEDAGDEEEQEEVSEEVEDDDQEEEVEEEVVDDGDEDYKPTKEPMIEENEEEENEEEEDETENNITKPQSKGMKRKITTKTGPPKTKYRKKNKQDENEMRDKQVKDGGNQKRELKQEKYEQGGDIKLEKEVHVNIEVLPELCNAIKKIEDVEGGEDSVADGSMEDEILLLNEETGEMKKSKFMKPTKSRAKVFKRAPSYYVYCDHDDSVIENRTNQSLPFCKACDRFKCVKCTLTFKKNSHLNRHVRIIHNKEKKYKCNECDARFTTNESLTYHKKWHSGVKDVACPICDKKFLVHKNLRKHMHKHHPGTDLLKRKKANHCYICDSSFSRKDRLEYHMLEKHPANNPDKECRICGQKFQTEQECFLHADAHANMAKVPVAKCPHCDVYCSSKNNLKRHIDRVHLNIKKYLCNECGKRFKGRDAFLYHVKRHKDPYGRDFECHICHKKIATEKGLEIHLRTHTGLKPYVCETCGKGFAQKGNMLSHQAVHFDDRPFECEECHRTFKKKFDLFKHMKRHKVKHVIETGDLTHLEGAGRVYECPVEDCKVLLCSTNDLTLHVRRHTNEKPFECVICLKTFAVKSRLVRHLKNVHCLDVPDSNLEVVKTSEWAVKMEQAREAYRQKRSRYQTVMIPQPSGEQIEVQIMTEDPDQEGAEDLLALSTTPTTFSTDRVKEQSKPSEPEPEGQEIQFKIETEDEESNIQIINVREDSSGEVQIHTQEENIVLDSEIIQTLLSSGQQTIYYYVDQ